MAWPGSEPLGFLRGLIIAVVTFAVASLLIDLPVDLQIERTLARDSGSRETV